MLMPVRSTTTSSRKKLAIFLPALYGGGAERTMLNLAVGVANRGHAVDLVLAQAEGPYLSQVPETVRVIKLNPVRLSALRTLGSVPHLVRYLRRERPDALLSALHANVVAVMAKRLTGASLRVVINEQNHFSVRTQSMSGWYSRLMPRLVRWAYPHADAVTAVSEGVADDLADVVGLDRDRIRVIYNPIVTPETLDRAAAPLGHAWFLPGEPPVATAIGRLTKQKAFEILIRAFVPVQQKHRARLLILGEGEDRPALEKVVRQMGLEQSVSLPGFVSNPYSYLARSALFVLSSRWEGLPTVLVEALACGVPCIATDCPSGPREILRGGQYGRLVPVEDVEALTRAIEAGLCGEVPRPPRESWLPYEQETIVDQYTRLLLGE
jgi:glycosyltransferase involved in cell wall biosynthesis